MRTFFATMKHYAGRYILAALLLVLVSLFYHFTPDNTGQYHGFGIRKRIVSPPFLLSPSAWTDSVFASLSLEERIGQMIMIPAYSNRDRSSEQEVEKLIRNHRVGGLIFFQGRPFHQAELTNAYQSQSKVPLFIAMDAEWGLGMRLDSTISYPRQMMLGAIRNDQLIYEMGRQVGEQLARLGVQINFAPVADVNNNPDNPVINSRSFGEDRVSVTSRALLYMQGMQDNQIIAVAKHFPGHGDTDVDSHTDLPVLPHARKRLDSLELFPFAALISSGVSGIMTAHVGLPALDSTEHMPASLSAAITDSLLKGQMGFQGLIFTDAMNMHGITDYYENGDAIEKAVLAGNDILLMPQDVPLAIRTISRMIRDGKIAEEEINSRCKKILLAKYWSGLHRYKPIELSRLSDDLNRESYQLLNRRMVEASLTVLSNRKDALPIRDLSGLKMASIAFGGVRDSAFQHTMDLYAQVSHCYAGDGSTTSASAMLDVARQNDVVIVSLHSNDIRSSTQYGVSERMVEMIDSLAVAENVVLALFVNPYILDRFQHADKCLAVVLSYENAPLVQDITAQMIFGAVDASGMLPVSAGKWKALLSGIQVSNIGRLKYSIPAEAGMSQDTLRQIDDTIAAAIAAQAIPGCQVLVVRNGIVVMNKAYGHLEYSGSRAVRINDLYDLASVTKVAATMPVLMKLYEEGLFDVDQDLSAYLPFLKKTDKRKMAVSDVLMHQAGLQSWIPFYYKLLEPVFTTQELFSDSISDANALKLGSALYINRYTQTEQGYISKEQSIQFPVRLAENMYIGRNWADSIYRSIALSPLNDKKEYLYSDLGFYLFKMMIDTLTGISLDQYADTAFYENLGAYRMCFNPLDRYTKEEIAPTEDDQYFRKQLVQGYVHDMGAAMLGGVSGHAGLFADANDLAKLFQMFLNGGSYAGRQYLRKETIGYFTEGYQGMEENRRALGFDKPETDTTKSGPTCPDASLLSYGHSGFTGTLVWNDPEYNLIYIFLSNRVFPDANNNKLVEMNVRTELQQVVYNAILDRKPKGRKQP